MDIFVKKPLLAVVVSSVLLLMGCFGLTKIPFLQFPQTESAKLVVRTVYPGSSAETVKGFITEPIERIAMTVPGVDYVDSSTGAGLSTVNLHLNLNENSTEALAELSARIDQISFELPAGAETPAIDVQRADRVAALFYLDVHAEGWTRSEVTNYLQRKVLPKFSAIDGVQKVDIEGGRRPAMRIWLDPDKMAALGLSADEILGSLRTQNVIAQLGQSENNHQRLQLLSNANLSTVDAFNNLVLRSTDNHLIKLGDVASVKLGEDRGSVDAKYNHDLSMYISIWPLPGANEIAIGDDVYDVLANVNAQLPRTMQINTGYDGTIYMREALNEILKTLIETVLIVGLVVLLLMGSLRSALVPLVTIPISILGAIGVMLMMGFSLNLLTILAIVLSVGLVVDDAIVVVENVARLLQEGESQLDAALKSAKTLLNPIIAMTFTLAVVYIPIGFVKGLTGSLFQEFAFSLAVAVIISGIVAITLSPVMSAKVLRERGEQSKLTVRVNSFFDRLKQAYGRMLEKSFNHKGPVLFVAVFLFLLSGPFFLFSGKELAPVEDQNSIQIVIESPPDATLPYINEHMNDVVSIVSQEPGFQMTWQILTTNGGFGGIEFTNYHDRPQSVQALLQPLFFKLNQVAGLRVFPILPGALPTAGNFDVELVVLGDEPAEVREEYAQRFVQEAMATNQFMFVDTNIKLDLPVAEIHFDHDKISEMGLSIASITDQISVFLNEQEVNRFNAEGRAFRVIPMVENDGRDQMASILSLPIKIASGDLLPLGTFVTIQEKAAPRVIDSFDQQPAFRILAGVLPHITADQALSSLEDIAQKILPKNYSLDYAGNSRQLRMEGNTLIFVLMVSLLLVFLALTVQFNSLRLPLVVILGTVPLALTGGLLFTFVSFTSINVYSQIGFVTLIGLIAKNGILMTEFAAELQLKGVEKTKAIIEASQVRLRPILMTTIATVLGHFPLVLVTGAGAESRNSIGIILVGGMCIGTLFTLFVLPQVYRLIAKETCLPHSLNAYSPECV